MIILTWIRLQKSISIKMALYFIAFLNKLSWNHPKFSRWCNFFPYQNAVKLTHVWQIGFKYIKLYILSESSFWNIWLQQGSISSWRLEFQFDMVFSKSRKPKRVSNYLFSIISTEYRTSLIIAKRYSISLDCEHHYI